MSTLNAARTILSPDAATDLARAIAPLLQAGDTVLLDGPIGAGKTHFARSLIQSRLPVTEDVPSPTFTLVQAYDAGGVEIWHCDLYRLTTPDELLELGLEDALEDAICLIEWPDRLADLTPDNALLLTFSLRDAPGARHLEASASSRRWQPILKLIDG